MALPIGVLLFMLGVAACFVWSAETLVALKGLLALGLLFWGVISLLVGYSERKARRECDAAINDEKKE